MTIDTALAIIPAQDNAKLTKWRRGAAEDAGRPVPHWGMDQVMGLVVSARPITLTFPLACLAKKRPDTPFS